VTRWFVQIEARFAQVWPLSVEEAVAERLDRADLLYGDRETAVLGDPGPILCVSLVVDATDADEAAASGWVAYSEALAAAGAEGYVNQRTVTKPLAELERRQAETRPQLDASLPDVTGRDWLVLRDDGRRTERP
jgi:hypothetical protein